ncbi:hypothetical protein SAMN05216359_101357 [Roseateles sp. YR242]|uniref:RnfH family protein n=1 Tax=Roseateles sp. YR242 TaxID=1855305 RepID=UPI0008BE520D|nr:RnfH family protein [Roseateles sp. YR242]SEK30383.1 hypothetical protein SAMN05216359_101357 [Roseateles sp. YR242]
MAPAEAQGRAQAQSPGQAPVESSLTVELLWSPMPGEWRQLKVELPQGSTVVEALRASHWFEEPQLPALKTGIWGKLRPLDTPLRDGDRVEVYRPLTVDPKEARRQRYKATGQRIVTRHRPLGRKA